MIIHTPYYDAHWAGLKANSPLMMSARQR